MSTNVKISEESAVYAREQSKVYHRTIGGQIDYWASIGRLAESHPGLTFEHLIKLMQTDQLTQFSKTEPFKSIALDTREYRFNRKEANER